MKQWITFESDFTTSTEHVFLPITTSKLQYNEIKAGVYLYSIMLDTQNMSKGAS